MPTILDATVVASAYDTSGNGGRKLVKTNNGNLFSVTRNTTTFYVHISTNNGVNWTELNALSLTSTSLQDICIATNGVYVYLLYSRLNTGAQYMVFSQSGSYITLSSIEAGQTALGNVSLAINEAKTELHATWASKNATYPNSFNIRYAKGTIATDGSVAWGAVEQVTASNDTTFSNNAPSIVLNSSNIPTIVYAGSGTNAVFSYRLYSKTKTGATWPSGEVTVYNGGGTYLQSSPSAIFVPQSVNGLANGRIWVAWHGFDATDSSAQNIRVSYSDDLGVTWSAMTKLTSGNVNQQNSTSITANKNNQITIVYSNYQLKTVNKITYTGAWDTPQVIKTIATAKFTHPSALYDETFNFTEPLFIYSDNAKVGFYGTWTTTTISVTQGSIGTKTDKANVLTYAITTDGTMSTITEKVNGVTIGTKTATSGQSLIAGLSQAQWDAVKFGKYKDVTGGLNTLTIEMGTEIFTYTFDKRPATDADMLSVAKAVQDSANVYLPAVKSKLGTAIRAKGGTVNDTDALEVMASAVGTLPVKKFKTGTFTISGAAVAITGLGFAPRVVTIKLNDSYYYNGSTDTHPTVLYGLKNGVVTGVGDFSRNSDGFTIPLSAANYPNGTWTYHVSE